MAGKNEISTRGEEEKLMTIDDLYNLPIEAKLGIIHLYFERLNPELIEIIFAEVVENNKPDILEWLGRLAQNYGIIERN